MNNNRCMSPEKLNRVVGIHGSSGMKDTLTSQGSDARYECDVGKPQNRALFNNAEPKKEVWKPKVTTQWVEGYRAPLTLQ